MEQLRGACIIGQSGGPTSVINASALGVIETALKSELITQVLGAEHGIKGVLNDRLFDMGLEDPKELELMKYTPSSALGSCRYKIADPDVDDTDYKRILEVFKKHNVRYFFYNGGNDSMDTCNKISKYMQSVGYECRVMGVPKTIDNDLCWTDHCPGFPIVLHGSSSVPQEYVKMINENGGAMPDAVGIPEEQLRKAASMAVCKINIDSDLRLAMTASIRKHFAEHPADFDPRQYLKPARAAIKELVAHKIVDVLGCDGKAF